MDRFDLSVGMKKSVWYRTHANMKCFRPKSVDTVRTACPQRMLVCYYRRRTHAPSMFDVAFPAREMSFLSQSKVVLLTV